MAHSTNSRTQANLPPKTSTEPAQQIKKVVPPLKLAQNTASGAKMAPLSPKPTTGPAAGEQEVTPRIDLGNKNDTPANENRRSIKKISRRSTAKKVTNDGQKTSKREPQISSEEESESGEDDEEEESGEESSGASEESGEDTVSPSP